MRDATALISDTSAGLDKHGYGVAKTFGVRVPCPMEKKATTRRCGEFCWPAARAPRTVTPPPRRAAK